MRDKTCAQSLNRISACFAKWLTAGDVLLNVRGGELAKSHVAGDGALDELTFMQQRDGGVYLMGLVGELLQHVARVRGIGRFAKNLAVQSNCRVTA